MPKTKENNKAKEKQPFTLTEQLKRLRNHTLEAKNRFHMTNLTKDKTEFKNMKNTMT